MDRDGNLERLALDVAVEQQHRSASLAQAEPVGGPSEDPVDRFEQLCDGPAAGDGMNEDRTVEYHILDQDACESRRCGVRAADIFKGCILSA